MVYGSGIRKHGALRWFTVLAVGFVVAYVLKDAYDLDLSRGSWHRYAVFGGLAVVSVAALEVWRRLRGEHDADDSA